MGVHRPAFISVVNRHQKFCNRVVAPSAFFTLACAACLLKSDLLVGESSKAQTTINPSKVIVSFRGFRVETIQRPDKYHGCLAGRRPLSKNCMLHPIGTYLHLPRIWYNTFEGIMHKSKADKLRRLASKRQIVTAKDARELGIPRTYLPRLAHRGDLEKVGRGLYSSRDFSGTEHSSLIEAACQIPKGTVCLLSALRFHNFTTQSPHEVWMAIGHKAWAPKISSPPVRLVRMSGQALHVGVKEYSFSGATLRVFSPAKTVADCFKFRSKVGLDVAIESLRECRRLKKASIDELSIAAKVCRVANVMRPYLESL
jgi:Transcriptional regulator, AbiEi antitoxin